MTRGGKQFGSKTSRKAAELTAEICKERDRLLRIMDKRNIATHLAKQFQVTSQTIRTHLNNCGPSKLLITLSDGKFIRERGSEMDLIAQCAETLGLDLQTLLEKEWNDIHRQSSTKSTKYG